VWFVGLGTQTLSGNECLSSEAH